MLMLTLIMATMNDGRGGDGCNDGRDDDGKDEVQRQHT